MVPERDKVDECFKQAYHWARTPDIKALVYALEGVARQIRDADDTQDNLRAELCATLNDSNVTMTASLDQLTGIVANNPGSKRGMFD